MNTPTRYPCPCCGYKTLNLPPPSTYLICPVCFWEDDGDLMDEYGRNWGSSNQVSLRQAQRNFLEFGACEQTWLKDVRDPIPGEERDPDWQPIDVVAEQTRLALIERIAIAFQDVTLGAKGVSLHQARAFDDYQDPMVAREIDAHIRWQDIPDEWIEKFWDVFSFMNTKGLRHAVPAYMTWCLRSPTAYEMNSSATLLGLLRRQEDQEKLFACLNDAQQQVILDFLAYIETYGEYF